MSTHYIPGASPVLISDRGLVATVSGNTEALITLVDTELVVLGVIESLSRGSLATLADFACVLADGSDLRIVLRGDFSATVGDQTWSGAGVATWIEQTVPHAAGSDVVISGPGAAADGPELPIGSGVVFASHVSWTSPAPETDVQTTPEAEARTDAEPDTRATPEADAWTDPEPEPDAPAGPGPVPDWTPGAEPTDLLPAAPVAERTIAEPEPQIEAEPEAALEPAPEAAPGSATEPEPESQPETIPAAVLVPTPVPASVPAPTPVPASDPEPAPTSQLDALDAMFGVTIAGLSSESSAADVTGDHDGHTITAAQLQALRDQAAQRQPTLRAAVVLADGTRHPVAPRLLIGRRPEARQLSTGAVPTMLSVDDPYVSSTHLDVTLDGSRLLVTDLSTNGTLVIRPGQVAQTLVKGHPTDVSAGTVLALSDGFKVTVELATGI